MKPNMLTSSDIDGRHLLPITDPGSGGSQPATWTPTIDEEQTVFRVQKGYTLAERSKDTLSWVWNYRIEIQSTTSRRWVCILCMRQKAPSLQSYESRGTQNAEAYLWKIHGLWDPSGRRSAPTEKKGGKRVFASIADFINLNRSDPKDQAFANGVIKRFDRGHFQKLVGQSKVSSRSSKLNTLDYSKYLNTSIQQSRLQMHSHSIVYIVDLNSKPLPKEIAIC